MRNRFVILSGLLTASLVTAILAAPLLAAQEATPEQPQAASDVSSDQPQTAPVSTEAVPQSSTRRVFKINWDNTVKYSGAIRVQNPSPTLIGYAGDPNSNIIQLDDGDRAFKRGIVSDRGDLLSEVDVTYGNFGARASGSGWGDAAYLGTSANTSPSTFNGITVNNDQWTEGTRDLMLGKGELLDAFAYGKFNIGNSTLTVRAGQFALLWGEGFFYGVNSIAGGMAPMDLVKLIAVPSSEFKEVVLPVPQVSAQYQITPSVAIGAYYKLRFAETRLPPSGSFYSFLDIIGEGAQSLIPPGATVSGAAFGLSPSLNIQQIMLRTADRKPKEGGEFGAELKMHFGDMDFGLYGIQYNETAGQLVFQPTLVPKLITAADGQQFAQTGNYYWLMPENIKAIAVSATKTYGNINYAMELGAHFNQDLVSLNGFDCSIGLNTPAGFPEGPPTCSQFAGLVNPLLAGKTLPTTAPNGHDNGDTIYAVGKTVHGQVSAFATVPSNFISKEGSWIAELAWNMLDCVDKGALLMDPDGRKHAVGLRTVYTPVWRQVFSGVDISIPTGLSFSPMARSAVFTNFGAQHGGDYTAGFDIGYLDAWHFGASFNGFYGQTTAFLNAQGNKSMGQIWGDRSTVSFNLRHTIGLKYKSGNKERN